MLGAQCLSRYGLRSMSTLANVPLGPPDAILGVVEAFNKDTHPKKINVSVGAYRDDNGKPQVLDCVRKAEQKIVTQGLNKEYLPITGFADFTKHAINLAYGDEIASQHPIVGCQSISGTGALRVGAEFLNAFHANKKIYVPTPTWGNHKAIFSSTGLQVESYRYFDKKTNGLDFEGMIADLKAASPDAIVLLHACAHNPTGVDPNMEQWKEISTVVKEKNLFVFFDMAYQGFASGDPVKDAQAVRHFANEGHKFLLAQSFAKNFGLYGERIGNLSVICNNEAEHAAITSQLKIIVRRAYSNPPISGARLVSTILSDEELYKLWREEVAGMANRIIKMRSLIKGKLEGLGSSRDWNHVVDQIGMFCYTGLSPEEVKNLTQNHHVYLTGDGRISVAGVNSSNVDHLAESIHAVTK